MIFPVHLSVHNLLEFNPNTGERLDYVDVARQLEENIRQKHSSNDVGVDIDYHIIGFAKVIGDITEGAKRVVLFFVIAFFITAHYLSISIRNPLN